MSNIPGEKSVLLSIEMRLGLPSCRCTEHQALNVFNVNGLVQLSFISLNSLKYNMSFKLHFDKEVSVSSQTEEFLFCTHSVIQFK